jgi:signal transduction histidine kinase
MNIRKKAILTIGLLFSLALITVIFISQTVILAGFEKLEKNDTEIQTNRAIDAVTREVLDLDTLTINNAAWNATYQFIQDHNMTYIESNWNNQCLSAANVNLIVFINSSGQIVFGRAFNTQGVNPESIISSVANLFPNESNLWNFSTSNDYTRGLMDINGTLFLVASRPILTDNYEGPVKGAFLMGRELSSTIVASLESQTNLQLEIVNLMNNSMPLNFREARTNLLNTGSVYVKPENSSLVAGYRLLNEVNGKPCAVLGVYLSRNIYGQGTSTVTMFTILLALLFIAFGATTVFFLEKTLLARVSKLTLRVQEITNTERISQRVILDKSRLGSKDDEVSLLSNSVNSMLDKIQKITGDLRKSERFAAIGELAVMIAHDLRNPLQGIKTATDFLSRDKASSPEKNAKMLDLVKADVQYCEKIVNDLLDYSREPKISLSKTDVASLLSASLSHVQVPENVRIHNLTTGEPKIQVDVSMMMRVFDNVIKNAIEAMPEGGNLTVLSEASASAMRISFADTGKGIPRDELSKLFVPLYTTKAKGMGFGLAICKRIIDAHKGTISIESSVGEGTKFTIELPR